MNPSPPNIPTPIFLLKNVDNSILPNDAKKADFWQIILWPFVNLMAAIAPGTHVPNVIFDYNELISGNFCPFADSTTGIVSIYCKIQPTA